MKVFEIITDIPEYRNIVRLANGRGADFLRLDEVCNFLRDEQNFSNLTTEKVEEIVKNFEPMIDNKEQILSITGKYIDII